MLTSASIISPPQKESGAASLAEKLFMSVGYMATIVPSSGSIVKCQHCRRTVLSVVGDCIVITERHDSQPHKSVIPLSDLGLVHMEMRPIGEN